MSPRIGVKSDPARRRSSLLPVLKICLVFLSHWKGRIREYPNKRTNSASVSIEVVSLGSLMTTKVYSLSIKIIQYKGLRGSSRGKDK